MPKLAADFITSVASKEQLITFNKPEAIVFGRSNVGKSTFINLLAGKKIAKTSSTPGRTKLLNFFDFPNFILVDAPGYGFARGAKDFEQVIIDYLHQDRPQLVIVLIDSRHQIKESDQFIFRLIGNKPLLVIATKKDKLNQKLLASHKKDIASYNFNNYFLIGHNDDSSVEKVRQFLTTFFD